MKASLKSKKFWRETLEAYTYLLPTLVILTTFSFYPVVRSLILSFYKWDMISINKKFVGIQNYTRLFQDPLFWKSIKNTAYYVAFSVPITIGLALVFALLLNSRIKGRAAFRLAYFMPYVTPAVAATMVWVWIFDRNYGLLNYLIGLLGFNAQKWLLDPKLALPAVIIVSVWQHLGYDVVIFLAGLQNINKEYYEAAKVDGANGWQTFRHITWPLLSPTTFFISIISIIGAFKIFTTVFVLFSGPGPLNSAMTIVYYIYQNAFVKWKMGYASAAAYVLFFIIFIFTLVQLRLAKNRVHY